MAERDAAQYLTIIGCEEHTLLLGVRAGIGNALDMLLWARRYEGKRKSRSTWTAKYSRCLIARVTL